MKIGTLTTGVGVATYLDLQYCPAAISYTAATQLTGLKVEVLGDGVKIDLDAAGLTAQSKHRSLGLPTNTYLINLADGGLLGKSVRFTFTNSAAQTPDVFAMGDNEGMAIVRTMKGTIIANNNTRFEKFAAMFLPNLAAGDKITITYEDGFVQIWEREDLQNASALLQRDAQYQIDNLDGKIKYINCLVATTQQIYIMDYEQV